MNRIAVIYYSKYGTTRQYARWICDAVGGDLFDARKTKLKDLSDYDIVVYGGGIYSGGIKGIELITKNWYKGLSEKKVICFGVGIMIDKEENREQCIAINFERRFVTDAKEDEGKETGTFKASELFKEKRLPIECYFLPGAYDPKKIKGIDKGIMAITRKMIGDDPAGRYILEYTGKGCDLVDKDAIGEIVEAVKRQVMRDSAGRKVNLE